MIVTSTGIINGFISKKYGGYGTQFNENNVPSYSLPFKIENAPENTSSFAFVLEDKDAYPVVGFTWIHWLGANLKKSEVKENESQTSSDFIRGILGMLFLTIERVLVTIYPELFRELILSLMLIPIIYLSLLLKEKNGTALMYVVFLCVTITHERDMNPLYFAWSRIVDTSLGIVVSLIVNSIPFHQLQKKV